MTLESLYETATAHVQSCPENRISAADAISPHLAGMQIFESPIFAVGAADDPQFWRLREPGVVGPNSMLPADWLREVRSVLSFFLPFSAAVRDSNRALAEKTSDEWLHARIEGQLMVNSLGAFLCSWLKERGHAAIYPAADTRFQLTSPFASNWSERHVAYICGLGTFGLSKGLITSKGMAGRFGSIVTSASLPITKQPYTNPFAYCTMCGKCQMNCPAQAIDVKRGIINGKNHALCAAFIDRNTLPPHGPSRRIRFGCGKCQVGVPCETGIPRKKDDPNESSPR